ncbi:MAG: hypothetical protein U5K54_09685 [Cytophagales bacterium]|nr:hypothetical protein [Cytophagales bacterium]
MKKCRWFGGKARAISKMSIHKVIPVKVEGDTHFFDNHRSALCAALAGIVFSAHVFCSIR